MSNKEELKRRQRLELKEFEKKAEKMRSFVPKKDKVGRQRTNEEIESLRKELLGKQKEDLLAAGLLEDIAEQNNSQPEEVKTINSIYVEKPLSKQQKKKKQKEQEEREADDRRAEARRIAGPSNREIELTQLADILEPAKLKIYDIPADGDCLFNAVAHQLGLLGISETGFNLRKRAARHMLEHQDDYMNFLEEVDGDSAKFRNYCEIMGDSHVWGGEVELRALSRVLQAKITVYAVGIPILNIGEEFSGNVLRLSFHRSYYELGEHYNSLVDK